LWDSLILFSLDGSPCLSQYLDIMTMKLSNFSSAVEDLEITFFMHFLLSMANQIRRDRLERYAPFKLGEV
jgi:hypothetical protein